MRPLRLLHAATLAVICLALLAPSRAHGQFAAVTAGNIRENAPIFTESAVVHDRGGASLGAAFLWIVFDDVEFLGEDLGIDITAWAAAVGGSFGVTDRITLGAFVPYQSFSVDGTELDEFFDVSGFGDVEVFGRGQLWRSADSRSSLTALASVTLPTADEEFFTSGESVSIERSPDFSLGGAIAHDAGRASLHGSIEYTFAGDLSVCCSLNGEAQEIENDGVDVLSLGAAAVFAATHRIRLIGEVQLDSFRTDDEVQGDDDTETALGAGIRLLPTPHFILDAGAFFPVTEDTIDAVLLIGASWVR
jgi:hypothetical protein